MCSLIAFTLSPTSKKQSQSKKCIKRESSWGFGIFDSHENIVSALSKGITMSRVLVDSESMIPVINVRPESPPSKDSGPEVERLLRDTVYYIGGAYRLLGLMEHVSTSYRSEVLPEATQSSLWHVLDVWNYYKVTETHIYLPCEPKCSRQNTIGQERMPKASMEPMSLASRCKCTAVRWRCNSPTVFADTQDGG